MSILRTFPKLIVILLASMAVGLPGRPLRGQEATSPENQQGPDGEPEVLLRGPIHEAFAKPYTADPTAGIVISKKPPDAIEEIAPDTRPEGNVIWILGYWAWDEAKKDFIWVSGVWRQPPPGRRWVPGYWSQAKDGWQWTSGFWAVADANEMSYLPNPPATLEQGPSSPAPGEEYFWVPGCWRYDNEYRWQPGFWSPYYDNWVWNPCHFVWTPRGCLFVNGYWDYGFYDRGYCFAPVFFHGHHHGHFRPHHVLSFGSLLHFFVHRGHHHYFFGDYYGHGGFQPWFRHHDRQHHDPLFVHLNHHFRRQGIDYTDRLRQWHDHFRDHQDRRPPQTLQALGELRQREGNRVEERHAIVARNFRELAESGQEGRFRRLDASGDDTVRRERGQAKELTDLRRRIEERKEDGRGRDGEARRKGPDEGRPKLNLPAPVQRFPTGERGEVRRGPETQRDRGRPEMNTPRTRESAPEIRRGGEPRSFERPRIERSAPAAPRIERSAPRQSAPAAPRIERSAPRQSAPAAPRVQRSAPRQSAPAAPRVQRSAPRQSAPAVRGGGGGRSGPAGGGGGGRSRGGGGGGGRKGRG